MASRKAPVAPKGPKFILTRIPLDRGGYANKGRGQYYGVGAPVFMLERDEDGAFVEEFRARDREAAKEKVRQRFPGARF